MPLYVQNGKLLQKSGALGTSVGCCCGDPPPDGPQCCCDETGFRVLNEDEECTGSQFPVPDPTPTITLVFEWCGLTAERVIQGGVDSYYATEDVDYYLCDTTGMYGEGVASYTQATGKTISVTIFPGQATFECGYMQHFWVGVGSEGVTFKDQGGGNFFPFEVVITSELYDCYLSQCYDGSEPDISMDLIGFTDDDTCGLAGTFNPCKFTTPELTVVGAP
jgi:hypothetical protein